MQIYHSETSRLGAPRWIYSSTKKKKRKRKKNAAAREENLSEKNAEECGFVVVLRQEKFFQKAVLRKPGSNSVELGPSFKELAF